jgi:hypothetical protein
MPPPEPGSEARATESGDEPDGELSPDAYKRDASTGGQYDEGPVSIEWSPQGASAQVEVYLDKEPVASKTLSPDDTNWDTGRQASSDSWCEASFELHEGQLNLVKLTWAQGEGGDENTTTNQLLASWQDRE